jgi:small conductance mechanosensitive channel
MNIELNESVWRTVAARALLYVPQAMTAALILLVFWFVAIGVERLIRRLGEARNVQGDALFVIARSAKLTLRTVGLMTALGTLGVDVTTLVTGLGLTGFAVGFALKDTISNLLAGMLILVYKPFQRRDYISIVVGNTVILEGTVDHIDLRYTTLERPDRRILIPNANLLTNAITIHRAGAPAEKPAGS